MTITEQKITDNRNDIQSPSINEIHQKTVYYLFQTMKYKNKYASEKLDIPNLAFKIPENVNTFDVIQYHKNTKELGLANGNLERLLPFFIYETAAPSSGELPNFTDNQQDLANEIRLTRRCIIKGDPEECLDLLFIYADVVENDWNEIINQALDYFNS